MNRLANYVLYTRGILNIKTNTHINLQANDIGSILIAAGLYKPGTLTPQHSLILASIAGQPPATVYQTHGKRMRRTVSLRINLRKNYVYPALDKLIHEIIPILMDFKTPKWRKKDSTSSYAFRIRQKFGYYGEFEDLITNQMYDTHRGMFLPLNINFNLNSAWSHLNNEIYLRLLHLPISMFRRRPRPAFDDLVKFQ